ncbi:MAG: hypothetical protein ACOYJY_00740 [Acutalibacteraceae bacterium]|jgi:hypothetical protein
MPRNDKVLSVTLDSRHMRLRVIFAAIFFVIALVAIGWGLLSLLREEGGWDEITAEGSVVESVAQDMTLQYRLDEAMSRAERRQVTACYTDAAARAWRVFHPAREYEGIGNLASLNAHPGEFIRLEPELYAALEALRAAGDRTVFLGPIGEEYAALFAAGDDELAAVYDPYGDSVESQYMKQLMTFIADESAVSLELKDGQARLTVSDAYRAFAEENEVSRYLDLLWMKNAFAVDLVADALVKGGFEKGYLVTADGFMRNFCREDAFTLEIALRRERTAVVGGEVAYTAPLAALTLHDAPFGEAAAERYYTFADGTTRTGYVDPADGLCKSALPDLTLYSDTRTCGQIALAAAPVYIADTLDEAALKALAKEGVYAVYESAGELKTTGKPADLKKP